MNIVGVGGDGFEKWKEEEAGKKCSIIANTL